MKNPNSPTPHRRNPQPAPKPKERYILVPEGVLIHLLAIVFILLLLADALSPTALLIGSIGLTLALVLLKFSPEIYVLYSIVRGKREYRRREDEKI